MVASYLVNWSTVGVVLGRQVVVLIGPLVGANEQSHLVAKNHQSGKH